METVLVFASPWPWPPLNSGTGDMFVGWLAFPTFVGLPVPQLCPVERVSLPGSIYPRERAGAESTPGSLIQGSTHFSVRGSLKGGSTSGD